MKKYSLVLTSNVKKINKAENLISIRPLKYILDCNDLSNNSEFNNISRAKIIKRYKFCEKIYNRLIFNLSIELNKFHKVNYSLRSWDIIAGKWLKNYIYTYYKTYIEIKFVLANYNINKIYIINQQKYDLTVVDTMTYESAFSDEEWFFSISSNIIKYLNLKKKIIKTSPKKKFFENINSWQKKNKKIKFYLFIFNLLKKIVNFDNYALITRTYLPFFYEKILEIKLFQFPIFWPEILVKYSKKKLQLRSNLKIKKNKKLNIFENLLKENLFKFIPNFILENFKEIEKLSTSDIYPKNPKFIFTSSSYAYDEVFKHYVAKKINFKIPYYIGQHGNNYFTKIHNAYDLELKYVDKFISWGFEKKPLIKKSFNFKVLKKRDHFNNNGKLIIIFDHLNTISYNLHTTNFCILDHIRNTIEVIKNLEPEIKKKTIIRLNKSFYQNFFGIKYINFFKKLNIEIDNGEKNIDNLLKESRLSLFNYDSTGVLENFIYKYPTIFFCEKNYLSTVNKDFLIKYNNLIKNNIMFLDKKKIIKYLNSNWNNISVSWFNQSSQIAIKKFNKNLNNVPVKNSLDQLKKILTSKKR